MSGLETAAAVTVGLMIVPFLTAWHAEGEAGEKYRGVVRNFGWFLRALITYPAGKAVGIAAWMTEPFSVRIRSYRYLRTYKGRHFDGMDSALILAEC